MKAGRASIWTEGVFHVLAHVDAGALAPSCFNPSYIAWSEKRLGPIAKRPLGEDARVLAQAATTHDVLARVQALAWVFDSIEQSERAQDRELASLIAEDVASFEALTIAKSTGAIAEVLRAACELELAAMASIDFEIAAEDDSAITTALDRVTRGAAPNLVNYAVSLARPMGLRGRMLGRSIVVGVPGISCPDADHLAWQAAHEASVALVYDREREKASKSARPPPPPLSFEEVERRALGLLRSRARSAGLGEAHGRWLARLDLRALGSIPDIDDSADGAL